MRVAGTEQDALLAARIVEDARAEHTPVRAVDDHRAHGIRPVVDADRVVVWCGCRCHQEARAIRDYPTSTGETMSRTSGPVPAARALPRSACFARIRTALSARFAKFTMLRSIARVGSSRYVN